MPLVRYLGVLHRHQVVLQYRTELAFSNSDIAQIVKVVSPFVNFSKLQINTVLQKKERSYTLKEFISLEIFLSWIERVVVEKNEKGEWKARKKTLEIETKIVKFSGLVEDSLWSSAVKVGLDPSVIEKLVQIFAWEIDFSEISVEAKHSFLVVFDFGF